MKFDGQAMFMYATGIGVLLYMFIHPDSVIKLLSGGLTSVGSYIGQIAHT